MGGQLVLLLLLLLPGAYEESRLSWLNGEFGM